MPVRLTLLTLLLALAWPPSGGAATLSAPEALERAERGELVLVDVRRPTEWARTGVPPGALEVPLQDASGQPTWAFIDGVVAALDGDRERPLALICATGVRSALAQRMLVESGFREVHHIDEGMLGSGTGPGWLRRSLPVEPCTSC